MAMVLGFEEDLIPVTHLANVVSRKRALDELEEEAPFYEFVLPERSLLGGFFGVLSELRPARGDHRSPLRTAFMRSV